MATKLPDIPGAEHLAASPEEAEWVNPDFTPSTHAQPHVLKQVGGTTYCMLPSDMNHLGATPDDPIIFPPEFQVIAAFDEKGLAGRTMICSLPHIEGTWVREDLRGGRVGFRLVKLVEQFLSYIGRSYAWAFVSEATPEYAEYMERMGYIRVPVTVWTKNLTPDNTPPIADTKN